MTTHNPQDLQVGEAVRLTGENWPWYLAGTIVTIEHIDADGQVKFTDSDGATWVADELPGTGWAVERVEQPAAPDATDVVNHPAHYKTASGLEAIDVMEAFNLHRDGRLFNAGKYILRAGQKDKESQDIRKAIWYLERYAAALEAVGQ